MSRVIERLESIEAMAEIKPHMSNFDHSIDDGMDEQLKAGESQVCSSHTGWNFFGYVWYENGKFHELVMQYHEPVDELEAPTLVDLMVLVNDKYGWA